MSHRGERRRSEELSHRGERRRSEELSHRGERVGRRDEGVDAEAWLREARPGCAWPDQQRQYPHVASLARSRAARVESEGHPKQRAVSCIQSNTITSTTLIEL